MTEIVYVFTNPAMPDYVKIGKTSRDKVEERLKGLYDSSGVPAPFVCLYAAEVADATKVEKALHKAFAVDRPNKRREFFTTSPDRIVTLLKAHEINDVTPSTQKVLDKITSPEDKSAQARVASLYPLRAPNWKFSEIGIEPRSVLVFVPDPTKKCRVVDGNQGVEYEKEIFSSLADLQKKLLNVNVQPDSAPRYFTHNGELLADIRKKFQNERKM